MTSSTTDWISAIAAAITAIGIAAVFFQAKVNRKQLYLATITSCLEKFRALEDLRKCQEERDIIEYVDLVNEELFYFQYGYLPKEIAYEWLDGMLDYLPLTDKNGIVLNSSYCLSVLRDKRQHYLKDFPRVKHTFTVFGNHDLDIIYSVEQKDQELRVATRKMVVEELYSNIRITFNEIHKSII